MKDYEGALVEKQQSNFLDCKSLYLSKKKAKLKLLTNKKQLAVHHDRSFNNSKNQYKMLNLYFRIMSCNFN